MTHLVPNVLILLLLCLVLRVNQMRQLFPLQVRSCCTGPSSFLYPWLRFLRIRIPLVIKRFLRLLILWNTSSNLLLM